MPLSKDAPVSVQAFELGNEPDAYVVNNYRAEGL